MNRLEPARRALQLGLTLAAIGLGAVAARWPTFFSNGPTELLALVFACAALPTALALVLGWLVAPRVAAAIAIAPLGAAIAAIGASVAFRPEAAGGALAGIAAAALLGAGVAAWLARREFVHGRRGALLAVTALAAAAATVALVRSPPAAPAGDRPRIVVFGLDAGTWTILDELLAAEQLPALKKLREQGASGVLRSEIESASPRVWTTIATGKTPAKHGVVDFFCTQNQDLKTRRVWEILQAQGWSVGLFQWLVTWPPDPYEPFVVPAWMARGPETQPAGLSFIKELEIAFQTGEFDEWRERKEWGRLFTRVREWGVGYLDHGLRWKTALAALRQAWIAVADPSWEKQYTAKRTLQLLVNGDVYLELYRRHQPDFSCFICYGTDNLAHKFWQFHYPDDFGLPHAEAAPFKDLLAGYYRACDDLLGELLPLLGAQTTVAVVSDHGFTSVGEGGESRQRELRPKMSKLAAELALTEAEVYWSSIATRGYFRPVPGSPGAATASRRILEFLGDCQAIGGPKVFAASARGDGQIEVAVNSDAPFERDTPIDTPLGRRRFDELVDVEDRTGNHSTEGIVLLRGPAIRRGARIEPARLADITPTLLHLHGFAVGADMDGAPIEAAFTDAFRADHAVERIASWDELVEVTRQQVGSGDDRAMKSYMSATGYTESGDEQRDAARNPPPKRE